MSTSSTRVIPAPLARCTVESLYADHGQQRPWIYWIALAGCLAALVALPLVKVDVTVRAPGLVRPAVERADLRVAVTGQISTVLAKDNDIVVAGQPLLILRSRDLEERLALNRARQAESSPLIADLAALADYVRAADFAAVTATPTDPPPPLLATAEMRADFAQFTAQLEADRLATLRARREFERNSTLASKGLIADRDLEQTRFDLQQSAAAQVSLGRSTAARWESRLQSERSSLDTLHTEEHRLTEESVQYTVRAPAAGAVQGLTGCSPGAWLMAGQTIGSVSPNDELLVETAVAPRDVGLVRTAQTVRLQIDAFSYTQWGMLDGDVVKIAEDAAQSNSAPVFKVTVKPRSTVLRLPNGVSGTLRKGMTANARFVVARRTLLQVLYEDVSEWLDPQNHSTT